MFADYCFMNFGRVAKSPTEISDGVMTEAKFLTGGNS